MKLLICGDVNGHFDKLFTKVDHVNQKSGPFDCLLCVGRFFLPDASPDSATSNNSASSSPSLHGAANENSLAYLQKIRKIPLPTYFIDCGSNVWISQEDRQSEICENLTFLGKQGIVEICGLRVAFLCGTHDETAQTSGASTVEHYTPYSIQSLIEEARVSARMTDVLLTCEWPLGLADSLDTITGSDQSSPSSPLSGENAKRKKPGRALIAQLARNIEPRYHFAGTENVFFQRTPYRNLSSQHLSRFIGLASLSSDTAPHKKWLFALNIPPRSKAITEPDPSLATATPNPFLTEDEIQAEKKRKADEADRAAKKSKLLTGIGAVGLGPASGSTSSNSNAEPLWPAGIPAESSIVQVSDGVRISVYVTMEAKHTLITACDDRALRVDVAAPPKNNQANRLLRTHLAAILDAPLAEVTIVSGQWARDKTLVVQHATVDVVRQKLKDAINVPGSAVALAKAASVAAVTPVGAGAGPR